MRFSVALTLVGFLLASGVARAQAGVDPKTLLTSGYTLDAAVTGDVFGDGSQAIAVLSHAAESDGTLPVGRADLFSCDGAGDICELVVSVPLPPFDAGGLFMTRLMGDSRQQ